MSRVIRSRRAGADRDLPMYARMLGLRHLAPNGFLCFVFLEGTVALGLLLALAELVTWWGVLVLPLTVAAMVKLNDVVAGALSRPLVVARPAGVGTVTPPPAMLRPAVIPRATVPEFAMTEAALSRASTVDLRNLDRGTTYGSSTAGPAPSGGAPVAPPTGESYGTGSGAVHGASVRAVPQVMTDETAPLNEPAVSRQWADEMDLRAQRARQSAARRYE